ncbi:hypothetical protein [Methylosinus sp. C49]|uniref:hypothetical protein n=1 Tax=Methylosinus sp. C49 TaxID=2699395 RepID=UPI001379C008|nr:hypothetical protein [Methylosinus sp. C49]
MNSQSMPIARRGGRVLSVDRMGRICAQIRIAAWARASHGPFVESGLGNRVLLLANFPPSAGSRRDDNRRWRARLERPAKGELHDRRGWLVENPGFQRREAEQADQQR